LATRSSTEAKLCRRLVYVVSVKRCLSPERTWFLYVGQRLAFAVLVESTQPRRARRHTQSARPQSDRSAAGHYESINRRRLP
jgi:hypothetical protein